MDEDNLTHLVSKISQDVGRVESNERVSDEAVISSMLQAYVRYES